MTINWFTPLYLLAIYGIVRYFSKPSGEAKEGTVNWNPLESAAVTLAIYFVAQVVGALLAYSVPALLGWDSTRISNWFDQSIFGQFIVILIIESISIWFLFYFLKKRKANFSTIGLKNPRFSDVGYALAGFLVYFLLYVVAVAVVRAFVPDLNLDQHQQIGFEGARHAQLVLVFISLVVLPPLAEELLVRGFLYSGLKKALPKMAAVLLTSGLFAIAHLQAGSGEPLLWIAAVDTFVLSLVLIYLKDKTGRLWAPIFLHALKNGIAFVALFVFAIH